MLRGKRINKIIVLLMIVVLGMVCLVGCRDKEVQAEAPRVPEGFDIELWEEGYESYVMLKNAIDNDILLTQDENDFIVDFLENKSGNALAMEELELYTMMAEVMINQTIVTIFEVQQQNQGDSVIKDSDIIQAKRKTKLALKHLDEMYDKYK